MRLTHLLCLTLLLPPQLWADEVNHQTMDAPITQTQHNKIWQGDLLPKQLDEFVKGQYSQVDGSVYINNSKLTDLNALSQLTSVSGDFQIGQAPSSSRKLIHELASFSLLGGPAAPLEPLETTLGGNPNLTSLKGLERLEQVGGALNIEDNPKLKSIKALSALTSLRHLIIRNNRQLQSLDGLQTLAKNAKQAHSFYLRNNPKITSISQLYGVESLSDLAIIDQPNLQSLAGLDKLKHISDRLLLRGNQQLKNLKGLAQLESIEGNLYLIENPSLTQIQHLSALKNLSGILVIEKNRRLSNLSGLENVQEVEALTIRDNTTLTSLKGLDGLTDIKKDVDIISNPLLEDMLALNQLTRIGGQLAIFDNTYAPLKGFSHLKSIKELYINTNIDKTTFAQLTNADTVYVHIKEGVLVHSLEGVLPRLNSVKILTFSGNKKLETLGDFLPNLEQVESLSISENELISDFNGLNNLKHAKEIAIYNNEGINKITGFNSLKKVEEMRISDNLNLQSITGFNALTQASRIAIDDNTDLLDLQGFKQLTQIDRFWVQDNKALERISAFDAVNTIKETLWIDNNPNLNNLGNIPLQNQVKELYIDDNPSLTNLNSFKSLKNVESLRIKNNGITNLTGLEQLQNSGYLRIEANSKLENIQALKNLTDVDTLEIDDNDALTHLAGLDNIKHINELVITDNAELNDYDGLSIWALNASDVNLSDNKLNLSNHSLALSAGLTKHRFEPDVLEKNISLKQLYFLRNEAFARQGFVFGKDDLIEYFSRFGWYKPDETAEIQLSDITEENIKIIKAIEAKAHANIQKAIDILKNKQSEFIRKDDAFFAPSVSRFAKTLSVKKLLSNNLAYTDNYLIQDDDCRDNLKIEFSDKVQSFNFTVNQCVWAEYDDETGDVIPLNASKLCNMRMADAQQEEGVYTTAQCEVDTKGPQGAQYLVQVVSYNFELEGDTFELARRNSYTTRPHYEELEEEY